MTSQHHKIGTLLGGHGLKGDITFLYFGDTLETLKTYSHVFLEDQTSLQILKISPLKHNTYKLSLKGITTRTQADLLKGKALYIQTSQLQPLKEEDLFYRSQLIGNIIETEEGKILGPLMAIHHFGASDILEGGTFRLPFIKEATPVIDLEGKRIIVKDAFVIYDDACPSSPSERHKLSSQRIDLLLEEKKT